MTPRITPVHFLIATVVPVALALGGCSQAEDAARDAANRAGCAVAQSALDKAQTEAEQALDNINADPDAAGRKLAGIRDAVKAAESGLSGATKEKIEKARKALDTMAAEAKDAAQGGEVDTSAVDNAKAQLDNAVSDVRDSC